MKLTALGEVIRSYRIQLHMRLKEMAEELKVTPAYLSGVETGRKKLTDNFSEKVFDFFKVRNLDIGPLITAASKSKTEVRISLDGHNEEYREVIERFARKFGNKDLSEQKRAEMLNNLKTQILDDEGD